MWCHNFLPVVRIQVGPQCQGCLSLFGTVKCTTSILVRRRADVSSFSLRIVLDCEHIHCSDVNYRTAVNTVVGFKLLARSG